MTAEPHATPRLSPGSLNFRQWACGRRGARHRAVVLGRLSGRSQFPSLDRLFAVDGMRRCGLRAQIARDAAGSVRTGAVGQGSDNNPRRIGLLADLFARHGGDDGKFEAFNRCSRTVRLWACHRRLDCDVAGGSRYGRECLRRSRAAAERLADASLIEPLRLLLERDLRTGRAARAAYQAGRRRGPMPAGRHRREFVGLHARLFRHARARRSRR